MNSFHKESTRLAIALMTEHMHYPDGGPNVVVDDVYSSGNPGELLAGMVNLVTFLLVRIEKETGKTHSEVLSDLALKLE